MKQLSKEELTQKIKKDKTSKGHCTCKQCVEVDVNAVLWLQKKLEK